jgi:hypothetical protein
MIGFRETASMASAQTIQGLCQVAAVQKMLLYQSVRTFTVLRLGKRKHAKFAIRPITVRRTIIEQTFSHCWASSPARNQTERVTNKES